MNKVYINIESDYTDIVCFSSKEIWDVFYSGVLREWKHFVVAPLILEYEQAWYHTKEVITDFITRYINEPVLFEVYIFYYLQFANFDDHLVNHDNYIANMLCEKYKTIDAKELLISRATLYQNVEDAYHENDLLMNKYYAKAFYYFIEKAIKDNKNAIIDNKQFSFEYTNHFSELMSLHNSQDSNNICLPEMNIIDNVFSYYCQSSCNGSDIKLQKEIDNILNAK